MTLPRMTRALIPLVLVLLASTAAADKQVHLTKTALEISSQVYFEVGKPVIKTESYPLLDEIAAVLRANPKIGLVEIQAHTDSRGRDEYNLEISQKRADAIYGYLIGKGIDRKRLRAKGYGETRPLDKRANEAAWAKNRRIAFVILQRA